MKRLIISIILAGLPLIQNLSAQSIVQAGYAYRYNGKEPRTPLENVTLHCGDAVNQTIRSSGDGSFEFEFRGASMGDRINCERITKRDMIVFNQAAVDEWSIRREPLILVMRDKAEFERQKQALIEIGRKEAEKKYRNQVSSLEAEFKAGRIELADKEAALNEAWDELARFRDLVEKYADVFARIDESEIDAGAQRAVDMFNKGEVDEAVRLFEEADYLQRIREDNRIIEQADQLIGEASEAKDRTLAERRKHILALESQAHAYELQNRWEDAGMILKGLADEMGTYEYLSSYALFAHHQNRFDDAESYYQKAVADCRKKYEVAPEEYEQDFIEQLIGLGVLYLSVDRRKECEDAYHEAIDILIRVKDDSKIGKLKLATDYNNLAIFYSRYSDSSSHQLAERLYLKSIAFYRDLVREGSDQSEPALGETLFNLAGLYKRMSRIQECEALYQEAEAIMRHVFEKDSDEFLSNYMTILGGLSQLYLDTGRSSEGEALLLESIGMARSLSDKNPEAELPAYAHLLERLADLYGETNREHESEELYEEVIEIWRGILDGNPAFKSDLARALKDYARLLQEENRNKECEELYLESADLYEQLVIDDEDVYGPHLAQVYNNLAALYQNDDFQKSGLLLHRAVEIYRRLAARGPEKFNSSLAETSASLARLKEKEGGIQESEPLFLEAIGIYRQLAEENPGTGESKLASLLYEFGLSYKSAGRLLDSEPFLLEATNQYRKLALINPKAYNASFAGSLYDLSRTYSKTGRLEESALLLKEAIVVYRELAREAPSTYEPLLAKVLVTLTGRFDGRKKDYRMSPYYLEAIDIFRRGAGDRPDLTDPLLGFLLHDLACLYRDNNRLQECEPLFLESADVFRKLSKGDPSYEQSLADVLFDLSLFYGSSGRTQEMETSCIETIRILRKYTSTNGARDYNLASMLVFLVNYYIPEETNHQEREEMLLEALDCFRRLDQNGIKYSDEVLAITYYFLGSLYVMDHRYQDGEKPILEATKRLRLWAKSKPDMYSGSLDLSLKQSAEALLMNQKFELAEVYAREALASSPDDVDRMEILFFSLFFQGRYDDAKKVYLRRRKDLKERLLNDLGQLENAGVMPPERKGDAERFKEAYLL